MRAMVKEFPIVLVTGGTGYIGSHTVLEILKVGCAVVVVDNLVNSHMESLIRVYHIAKAEYSRMGRDPNTVPPLIFQKTDLRDRRGVSLVFQMWQMADPPMEVLARRLEITDIGAIAAETNYKMRDYKFDPANQPTVLVPPAINITRGMIMSVVHFAALKAVGESVSQPLQYYQNNITGLLNLLDGMATYKVTRLVFSSSAVVYGSGKEANISEDSVQVGGQGTGGGLVTNPYGRSKWMAEEILNDCCIANPEFEVVALRYFNPTGSHPSGLIGEDPKGTPNNIVPVILQAYQRRRSKVYVYGSDYDTSDGTGVRDYIHVEDLARGHLAALRSMMPAPAEDGEHVHNFSIVAEDPTSTAAPKYRVYNLGTGHGYSVLDIIKAFASAADCDIPFAISDARPGDLGTVTASTTKATTELGWQAEFGIQDMCRDVYNFATENPAGYERLRKLSTLALADPTSLRRASVAMRKASVATGLFQKQSSLGDIVEEFANLSCDKGAFNNYIRRLSTIPSDYKDVVAKQSPDEGIGADVMSNPPQWGLFAESWHEQALPVHAK
jgi:UDP-glucose 4-epimerase